MRTDSNRILIRHEPSVPYEGFTLIELLIVIAIVLILIAIALPNFLEAQIRARVTKTKGEIRSLGIAMESYFLDFGVYPSESEDNIQDRGRLEAGLAWLTSPIAYITSLPTDVFEASATEGAGAIVTYELGGTEVGGLISPGNPCPPCTVTWVIFSRGPDQSENEVVSDSPMNNLPGDGSVDSYSPTNGTKSLGDVFLFGGDGFFVGVTFPTAALRGNYRPGVNDRPLVVNRIPYLHRLPPPLE